jgi:hypothetical protein
MSTRRLPLIAALALAFAHTAAAAPAAVVLKPGFAPNPLVVEGVASPPTVQNPRGDYPFLQCGYGSYTSAEPAYQFTVAGQAQDIKIFAGGAWIVIQNEARHYDCGEQYQGRDHIQRKLAPGKYSVFFVSDSVGARPQPHGGNLVFEDVKRPIAFREGGRVIDVPAHPTEPILVDGTVAAQPEADRGWCQSGRFGREPDFFVRSPQPVSELRIALAWSPKREWLRVLTPGDPRRPLCPSKDATSMTFDLFEGTYAVWVGDAKAAPGTPYRVAISTRDMKLDNLTTYSRPTPNMTLKQRAVGHHYWRLGRYKSPYDSKKAGHDELTRRLFLEAPKELFVFARVDLQPKQVEYLARLEEWNKARLRDSLPLLAPAPPRAGEPLLVIQEGDFITADGEVVRLDSRLVSLDPPAGPPAVPRAPRVTEAPYQAAEELAESDEPKRRQAFNALAEKAQNCYIKYMDTHNRSGDARQFEVITRRGGEVSTENLADRLDRVASAQCHLDKVEKERPKITAALAAARTKRRTADLARIDERLRTLFAAGAPRKAGAPAPEEADGEGEAEGNDAE